MLELVLNNTALLLIILSLAGLAAYLSERAGVVNIAIEGMMIMGAFTFAVVYKGLYDSMGSYGGIIAIFPAAIVGALTSLMFVQIVNRAKTDHVIAGTFINILAPGLTMTLTKIMYDESQIILSISALSKVLGISLVVFIFMVITAAIYYVIYIFMHKTKYGLRAQASGDNPVALAAAGVDVHRVRTVNLLMAGALAGIAGGISLSLLGNTFRGSTNGYGFLALVILVISQWKMKKIPVVALGLSFFIAFLYAQTSDSIILSIIPKELTDAIPFILPLIVLVFYKGKGNAPKAAGRIIDNSSR